MRPGNVADEFAQSRVWVVAAIAELLSRSSGLADSAAPADDVGGATISISDDEMSVTAALQQPHEPPASGAWFRSTRT